MKLVLPYPPTLNHLRMAVRGRLIKTSEAREYETRARFAAKSQGAALHDGPLVVYVRAYRPRRVGDLDNVLKAAFDSLTGILWTDDSQVIRIHAERHDDKENPRLEVEVEAACGAGSHRRESEDGVRFIEAVQQFGLALTELGQDSDAEVVVDPYALKQMAELVAKQNPRTLGAEVVSFGPHGQERLVSVRIPCPFGWLVIRPTGAKAREGA